MDKSINGTGHESQGAPAPTTEVIHQTDEGYNVVTREPGSNVSRTNSASLNTTAQHHTIAKLKTTKIGTGWLGKATSKQNTPSKQPSNPGIATTTASTASLPKPDLVSTTQSAQPAAAAAATTSHNSQLVSSSQTAPSNEQSSNSFGFGSMSRLAYEKIIEDLKNKLVKATKSAQVCQKESQTWKKEYELVRAEMEKMCDEQEKQAENFRRMQESAFQHFDSAEWMPEANEDITRKLRALDVDIKGWSKTYAVPLLSKIGLTNDQMESLMACLESVTRLKNRKIHSGVGDDRAWMLLQACLTHGFYTEIFEDPFFFLGARLSGVKPGVDAYARSASFAGEMSRLYEELSSIDKKETFAWRAQTLRLLDPPLHSSQKRQQKITKTKQTTNDARDKAALQFCDSFLQTGVKLMLKSPSSEAMEKALQTFGIRAAQISYSLWVQKKDLVCKPLADLPETFSYDHPLLEAHQLHNKHLNDNPARLDGLPILVVTHPAVLSFGNNEGSDYSVCSVLKKAICWMGDLRGWKQ